MNKDDHQVIAQAVSDMSNLCTLAPEMLLQLALG